VGIEELHCFHDVCWSPSFESAITWSVDDTSVVSARVVVPDTLSPDSSIVYFTFFQRTIRAGEEVDIRVRVLDRTGRRIAVPVDLEYVGNGTVMGESRERVPYTFPVGRAVVIARFGPMADTLVLDVLPARKSHR
jgi:hypothetical protein